MKKKKGRNIYSYLVLKLLLAFSALLLMQVGFYVANCHILRPSGAEEWGGILLGNVVFCLATVTTFLLPWFVLMLLPFNFRWEKWCRIVSEVLYILPVLMILAPRGANMAYYQYTYRLLSDEIFSYLGIGGQMGSLLPLFVVDYWYGWVLPLVVFILFLFLNSRIRLAPRNPHRKHVANDLMGTAAGALVVLFLLRGGIGPFIQTQDASQFAQPKNTALVNNDAYNILRTLFTPDLEPVQFMSSDQAAQLYTPLHTTASDLKPTKRNVVLLIVESLSQEYMGCYNTHTNADTRTPFLDSLAQYCTLYDGRANGKKSIEGITAINTSIPNLMSRPLTNSKYSNNRFTGLPGVLKRHGYHTAFYHGTYNGVMDFDRTCAKIGFDEYLGKNEYEASDLRPTSSDPKNDYDGAWGILDEPFLQYTVRHISQCREPFFAEVFTVSSHHPYPIPEQYKDCFPEGRHPILKCIEYTDHALKRFFDEAKQQTWYDSTLFIICGDHSAQGLSPEYNDYDGWYRIPMMVFDPQQPAGRRDDRIVQQIDLFPTLLDWLAIPDETIVCFGESVVRHPTSGWQVYYGNDFYALVTNNATVPQIHDLAVIHGDYEQGHPLHLLFLKALIQQYNDRIINDKLLAP